MANNGYYVCLLSCVCVESYWLTLPFFIFFITLVLNICKLQYRLGYAVCTCLVDGDKNKLELITSAESFIHAGTEGASKDIKNYGRDTTFAYAQQHMLRRQTIE